MEKERETSVEEQAEALKEAESRPESEGEASRPETEPEEGAGAGEKDTADQTSDSSEDGTKASEGADELSKPEGEDAAGTSEGGETSDGKWNFFKKKKDPKDVQIEELTDRLRRTMAEFDNFRKRTEKEKSAMFEIGAKDIVERILPVIDNFERGLSSMPEDMKGTPFASGMEMIYKQLLKNLEDAGVKPIEAVGKPFDPNFHNAVMHVEDENLGENVVAQELQKGYMYRDSVVRHSMVQVAN